MPSFVSSSSLVAKLPRVTMTCGSISASCRSSHGAHASISSVADHGSRRAALHHVRDVDVVAREADAFDQLREQLTRAADKRLTLQVLLLARPSPTNMRSASARPTRTRPASGPPRACTAGNRPRPRDLCKRVARVRAGCDDPKNESSDTALPAKEGPARAAVTRRADATGRAADRLGDEVGRHRPQSVEIRLDRAGCQCDREVAVESGVRGAQRTRHPVVRALRDEVTTELVARGVGRDDDERRVAVRGFLFERRFDREGERVGRRGRAREDTAVVADDVADCVDHGKRDEVRLVTRSDRGTEPAGNCVLASAPLADRCAAARADAAVGVASATASIAAPPRRRPAETHLVDEIEHAGRRHDRDRTARVA